MKKAPDTIQIHRQFQEYDNLTDCDIDRNGNGDQYPGHRVEVFCNTLPEIISLTLHGCFGHSYLHRTNRFCPLPVIVFFSVIFP